ncbi:MAG: inner membrane CreD family protein, partial [Deltaproteobacteria bacterium]|nr:inner membrane CreD family protein [Deltaproteobacteria bacterium]
MSDTLDKVKEGVQNSVTIKAGIVALLVIALLIPAIMVKGLVKERKQRMNSVVSEVSGKWGDNQTL